MKANWTSTENSMCGSLGKNTNQASLPTGASVADVVGTWTRQMGYPFIRVNTDGKTLKVQQGKTPNQSLSRIIKLCAWVFPNQILKYYHGNPFQGFR